MEENQFHQTETAMNSSELRGYCCEKVSFWSEECLLHAVLGSLLRNTQKVVSFQAGIIARVCSGHILSRSGESRL